MILNIFFAFTMLFSTTTIIVDMGTEFNQEITNAEEIQYILDHPELYEVNASKSYAKYIGEAKGVSCETTFALAMAGCQVYQIIGNTWAYQWCIGAAEKEYFMCLHAQAEE